MSNVILSEGLKVSHIISFLIMQDTLLDEVLEENKTLLIVGALANHREEGYTYSILAPNGNIFTWCTYIHRNTDKIIINGKKGTEGMSFPYNGNTCDSYLYCFDANNYYKAFYKLRKNIISFIKYNRNENS